MQLMNKILATLLLISSVSFGQVKLNQIEKSSGTYSTVTTNTAGTLGYVPEQTLTVSGSSLSISRGNTVIIPTSSTTILTASTGITINGTAPNYTISASSPSLNLQQVTSNDSVTKNQIIFENNNQNLLELNNRDYSNSGNVRLYENNFTFPTINIDGGNGLTVEQYGSSGSLLLDVDRNANSIKYLGNQIATTNQLPVSTNSFVSISGSSLTAKPNYVTPEMYGAVGDGSTNDATALQNAINTGSLVLLGNKNYRISSPLTFTNNVRITGSGNSSTISSITNSVLINITGSNNSIDNITLSGNAAGANQIGVQMLGVASLSVDILNNIISNSRFQGLYTGVSTTSVVGSTSGAKHEGALTLNSNIFNSCTYGLVLGARAEYNIISSNKFESCVNGVSVLGGNNNFNENYIVDCTKGIVFIASSNDTHSSFNGGKINHCTTGISGTHSLDFAFNGTQIFASNISLTSSGKTIFNNCEIGLSTNTLSINTSTVYFNSCNFSEAIGTYTVTGNKPIILNCYRGANQMITPTVNTSASFVLNNGAIAKGICNFYDNDALVLAVADGGHLTFADGVNVVLSSSTGTKFGTATTQKLAFYNSTPIVQPSATTDLGTVLSNLGLRASGTAYPISTSGVIASTSKTNGIGYAVGSGSTTTQATSRTTGVTINAITGSITLVSAAGSTTYQTFTVTNSAVTAKDVIIVNQQSGADTYETFVTNVAAGSFKITFATTGGTTTEQPVFNFAVIKGQTN